MDIHITFGRFYHPFMTASNSSHGHISSEALITVMMTRWKKELPLCLRVHLFIFEAERAVNDRKRRWKWPPWSKGRTCRVCSQRTQQTQMSGGGILRANKMWCFVLTRRILNKSVKILLADIVCLASLYTCFFHSLFSVGPWIFRSVGMFTFYALRLLSLTVAVGMKSVQSCQLSHAECETRRNPSQISRPSLHTCFSRWVFILASCVNRAAGTLMCAGCAGISPISLHAKWSLFSYKLPENEEEEEEQKTASTKNMAQRDKVSMREKALTGGTNVCDRWLCVWVII